jgi:hypothetical protein
VMDVSTSVVLVESCTGRVAPVYPREIPKNLPAKISNFKNGIDSIFEIRWNRKIRKAVAEITFVPSIFRIDT